MTSTLSSDAVPSVPPPAYDAAQSASLSPPNIVMPADIQVSSSFDTKAFPAANSPSEPPPPYQGDPAAKTHQPFLSTEAPPLAYLDIMPRMLTTGSLENEIAPTFDSYPTVIATANQWLSSNPSYMVWKCETVEKKVDKGPFVDMNSMLHHDSTFGFNVYVRGLRLWVTPKEPHVQAQQLGPTDPSFGYGLHGGHMMGYSRVQMRQLMQRQSLKKTLAALNERLKSEPLPGQIMNVETAWDKAREGFLLKEYDPDCMCRHEKGGSSRLYLQVVRIFYLIGPPAHEEIDIHDTVPQCTMKPSMNKPPKFQSFTETVYQTGHWLQQQQGIRIVNIVSQECPLRLCFNDVEIETNSTVEQELFSLTNHFVKVVRVIFVRSKATASSAYGAICLTSKLFLPVRLGQKSYETMPVTVWRIASWLRAAGLQIFGVDTQRMLMTNISRGSGVQEDRVDTTIYGMRAKYWVTGIRVYFGCMYQEPPPHMLPPAPYWEITQQSSSSTCNLL
ncbi:uncharacterized protein LOC135480928 [Liolophura sinensis]|uniref:uncharacterized protein LOC135480928 n=1 Tax=Liolophura sinensis TaxID=3198878 RepID=UPI003158609A